MERGEWYLPSDAELKKQNLAAKELLFDFHQYRPSQVEEKRQLLQRLFGSLGENAWIEPPFSCDYGWNIHAGKSFYANSGCVILDCGKVTIGDHVLLGPQVGIYTVGHPLDPQLRRQGLEAAKPITIGNNVWIGGGSILLPGVTIGENAVIGAGSVVVKDIPANVVAVGNPCRVIRSV